MRLLAIGDIHGHLEQLEALLKQVAPTSDDQMVFLGDYIDRGPDSKGVVDGLLRIKQAFPRTVFLQGNHERMLLDFMAEKGRLSAEWKRLRSYPTPFPAWPEDSDEYLFKINDGRETLRQYGGLRRIPGRHIRFFQETRWYYRTARYFFAHAGLNLADPTGDEQGPFYLLWSRIPSWRYSRGWKTVVHGHTIVAEPVLDPVEINLDTGPYLGGKLTCCNVLTKEIWQA